MAGLTEKDKERIFFIGDFINKIPRELLKNDENYFNYVINTSSTFKYINEMKKIIQK
jgi:hypothetical protein